MMFGGTSESVTVGVVDADGEKAPLDRAENRRRWYAIAGSTVGAVGFAACMTTLYQGARSVEAQGGFCASGGPYVIQTQCSSGETHQLLVGILGILVFGAIFVGLTAFADGPVLVPSGLLWAALFGSLGVGFLLVPKGGGGANYGVAIPFLLMGAGGVWPAITSGLEWLKRGGEPEPDRPAFGGDTPLVRAAVQAPPNTPEVLSAPAGGNRPVVPSRLVIPPKDIT